MANSKFSIDYINLYEMAESLRHQYKSNNPFPHVKIDNFLNDSSCNYIKECFPDSKNEIWKKPDNPYTMGKYVVKLGEQNLKELMMSDKSRQIFFELNSGLFLRFLEKLTGINGLLADPYFAEGGFHQIEKDGFCGIHADFSHHDHLGLERRVNLLYYLNENWKDSYKGNLSLYDQNLNSVKSYQPIDNRCIIFTTSDDSFHGHPEPLNTPDGYCRRSVALYYYTVPTETRKKKRILYPEDPNWKYSMLKQ